MERNTKSVAVDNMEIKLFKNEEIKDVLEPAQEFCKRVMYSADDKIFESLINSVSLALAYEGDKIVGIGRTVGDGNRFTYIVDLVVKKEYRGKGIGKALVQILAKNANTKFIELTTDPNDPGLEKFYKKAGFKLSEGEKVFEWGEIE